jgi:hypothetical protein
MGQVEQEHMGDLSTSVLGDSILHLLACYHAQGLECLQSFVPLSLDHIEQNRLSWISLRYTGSLDSRDSPLTPDPWCAASILAKEEGGYMEAQAPADLTSLLLWPAEYIKLW